MKKKQRKWNRDLVIEEIKKLDEPYQHAARNHITLYGAACRYFGSWKQAISTAGLDCEKIGPEKKWNKDLIIEEIRKIESFCISAVKINNRALVAAAARAFGSWKNAIEAAGLDYEKIKLLKTWTEKDVIKEIKLLDNKSHTNTRKNYRSLYNAGIKHFGSWQEAVESAGFIYENEKACKTWDKEKLIEEIKRLKTLSYKIVEKNNLTLLGATLYHFGSWEQAISAAGFNYDEIRIQKKWDKEKIKKEIKKLENFYPNVVKIDNRALYRAARRHFGSWREAIEKSGINYNLIENSVSVKERYLFDIVKNILPEKTYSQYNKFEWLKYERKMHLDIYNPSLKLAIEYQGEQHYRPVKFSGISDGRAKENLRKTQERDRVKKKLLKKNGIKLIEIKYDEKLTEDLILKKLKKAGINV